MKNKVKSKSYSPQRSLFKLARPGSQLHPSFKLIANSERSRSTRRMLTEAFQRFPDRDQNFVEQFQSFGFDSRTFELFVSELLYEEGFSQIGIEAQPDFLAEKDGQKIAIECTTTNRTDDGSGVIRAYRPTNEIDSNSDLIFERADNEIPIRIGGALRSKMLHRVNKRRDPKAYWELPHCADIPFIIAVQTFHEHGSLGFSAAAVARYLYGVKQSPSWNDDGTLSIVTEKIDAHSYKEKIDVKSNFFSHPGSENVSAILWTNAGTIPKFTRMALSGPYPDQSISMLRFGSMYNPDPNAHLPLPFAYIVGDPDSPIEVWGQEATLFHNPRARNPVPRGLFARVNETVLEGGIPVDYLKNSFLPYNSVSQLISGPGHRQAALAIGHKALELLSEQFGL